jgi:hypothetical protein
MDALLEYINFQYKIGEKTKISLNNLLKKCLVMRIGRKMHIIANYVINRFFFARPKSFKNSTDRQKNFFWPKQQKYDIE